RMRVAPVRSGGLTFGHIQQRDGRWCIVDLVGKRGRIRTAPMPAWVNVAIDAWSFRAPVTEGHVFRSVRNANVEVIRRCVARSHYKKRCGWGGGGVRSSLGE